MGSGHSGCSILLHSRIIIFGIDFQIICRQRKIKINLMGILKDLDEKEGRFLKNRFTRFFSFVNVVVLVVAGFLIVSMNNIIRGEEKDRPQISVSGEGKIFVKPDVASFSVTMITSAKRIGDAQHENSTRSTAVVDFFKQNGIQEKDIKTVSYSLQPQYQYGDTRPCLLDASYPCPIPVRTPPQIVSYEVRHSLEVKVRDLAMVDNLLEGVVGAGVNDVGSVFFTVDDEKKAMATARKLAIDDAKKKAQALSRDLGVRLKKITGFSESGGGYPMYARMGLMKVEASDMSAPSVQPGEQEVQSNVTITYELR